MDPKDTVVLIVDDEEDLRDALVFDFKRRGFQALSASGGTEALRIITDSRVSIVITDLHMPQGNGAELAAGIRKMNMPIPIIMFVSDTAPPSTDGNALESVNLQMSKPFAMRQLYEAVVALLTQAKSEREI